MKTRSWKGALAGMLAVLGFAAAPANAQLSFGRMDTGLYLGGAGGVSQFRSSCNDVPVACDDRDTGWKAFAGYQFTKNLAVEGGYTHLGKISANGVLTGVAVNADGKAKGWELTAIALFPVYDAFSVYGKLGAFWSEVDVAITGTIPGFTATTSTTARSTSLTYGAGVKYAFTPNVGARLEWQRYQKVEGGSNNGDDNIDLFSLGLLYNF